MEKPIPIYRTHFIILLPLVLLIGCTVSGPVVKGSFYESSRENSPGVLLLHGWRGSPSNWDIVSSRLEKHGYTVYALDLPQGNEYEMVKYVDEAYKFLIQKKIDPNRIALVGESTGANLALLYAAKNKRIKTIVLLSPGFDFRLPIYGPKHEIEKYGNRPILIIASEADPYRQSPQDSEQLFKWAKGKKELRWAPRGHGIGMLSREVLDHLINWLNDIMFHEK